MSEYVAIETRYYFSTKELAEEFIGANQLSVGKPRMCLLIQGGTMPPMEF